MFLRPDRSDLQVIGFYVGKVIFGIGLLHLPAALVAAALGEWNPFTALLIGGGAAIAFGRATDLRLRSRKSLEWSHGMVTVALSWLIGPIFAAIPLYLSGNFGTYLDAYFDAMSGLTCTGLTLIQDLDHAAVSINLWRHLLHFAGGQGIIIVVLSMLAGGGAQVGTMYFGEGRDERILPNIVRTSRFIYLVAFVYLGAGTLALTLAGLVAGLEPGRSLFHGLLLFMTTFDTGGFAPTSASAAYYHSVTYEVTLIVLMFAGAFSFAVHYQLWAGDRRELLRNLEARTLGISLATITFLALIGLGRSGAFSSVEPLYRKGVFTMISAQTTTGVSFNPARLFVSDWGLMAPAAIVGGMAIGGMASSTAGGIKAVRVGLAAKGLWRDIRRVLLPESALVVSTYHAGRRRILSDDQVRAAVVILLLYLLTYLGGAMLILFYGRWEFTEAMFESTAAASNGGLSIGIATPDAPIPLKIAFIIQMWLGRLEFMAVFALVGYVIAVLRGRT